MSQSELVGEQKRIFRSGDRVRVTCGAISFSGSVLAVRPDGFLLCLLDNEDRAREVDPSKALIQVIELSHVPKLNLM